ncbi:unnamed protein product [Gulo gulo]|uniref:Uncharacterized protein n=1 Tax=Gulo gulo TaxID=48420 RepID=A0A9X9LMA1_GULGU|nr:unnamed protein product [Gulo gulo]
MQLDPPLSPALPDLSQRKNEDCRGEGWGGKMEACGGERPLLNTGKSVHFIPTYQHGES